LSTERLVRGGAGSGVFGCLLILLILLSSCRQDMHDQPRFRPLRASQFFEDGRSARPLVSGTVARGRLQEDEHFSTGKVAGQPVDRFPFPATRQVLDRGRERYNIFCAPCHDRLGHGEGMVVRRGFRRPPSFHTDRLAQASAGHFFDVITSGLGVMPDYAAQIPPGDRWAIIAYVRALQLSQRASLADVPAAERPALQEAPR
jgi:hypothetical protein